MQARVLLTAAGWSPERQYDATKTIVEPLETVGWQIFPEAQRIFATLGMLKLNCRHLPPIPANPRITKGQQASLLDHLWFASSAINFDPYEAFYVDDEDFIIYWSAHPLVEYHGDLICPIASTEAWDTLFVCHDGLIVQGSIEFMSPAWGLVVLGDCIETALNQIAYDAVVFC
ncbi:SUKH-3 domain-containing protein [Herpetosiphon llansteffanensis]